MDVYQTKHSGNRFQRLLERVEGLTFIAALLAFIVSVSVLGWYPAKMIQQEIEGSAPETMQNYTSLEALGREVYAREGCAYCHSQLVRRFSKDIQRFGPSAKAWEYQYDLPHLLGTRRIGPDLSRESGARTDEWHYAHFYNPRFTVPESMMPSFPWLFEKDSNGKLIPTREGRALVAYINFLGREIKQQSTVKNADEMQPSTGSSR